MTGGMVNSRQFHNDCLLMFTLDYLIPSTHLVRELDAGNDL